MANTGSEMGCAIFAHVRDSGGFHSAAEIAEEFAISRKIAARHLHRLHERRALARSDKPEGKKRVRHLYGFVRGCVPPLGQSAQPLE